MSKTRGGWNGDHEVFEEKHALPYVRQSLDSGNWYPSVCAKLKKELDGWMDEAEKFTKDPVFSSYKSQAIKALIVPHQPLPLSGETAAHALFKIRTLKHIKTIFVLGPSHFVPIREIGIFDSGALATQFGILKVNTEIVHALQKHHTFHAPKGYVSSSKGLRKLFKRLSQKEDEQEHSIERVLPFIKLGLGSRDDVSIVPLIVGTLYKEDVKMYINVLKQYFIDPSMLFVISTDFCHWGARFGYMDFDKSVSDHVTKLDKQAQDIISEFNPEKFKDYLDKSRNTICGRDCLDILMRLCNLGEVRRNCGLSCQWTRYEQSSKIAQPAGGDILVGYAAGIIRIHGGKVLSGSQPSESSSNSALAIGRN
jgi:AmmeMemoRadiSam system protein B